MPLARALSRTLAALAMLALGACETTAPPLRAVAEPTPAVIDPAPQMLAVAEQSAPAATGSTARMPREIRTGMAEMAIQRVEREVTREEVAAAVQRMIDGEPICMQWPALWLENLTRTAFTVRYGYMTRDWGPAAAASAQARMQDFVAMGFMVARERPELGDGAVEYTLTALGRSTLRGEIEAGRRPNFCAPSERRLVEITSMEWGQYPCGSLRVQFTHVGNDWPSWARSEAIRERLTMDWPPIGEAAAGTVSFSRQWYRPRDVPSGRTNGSLQSLCYDSGRDRITGDDLDLSSPVSE